MVLFGPGSNVAQRNLNSSKIGPTLPAFGKSAIIWPRSCSLILNAPDICVSEQTVFRLALLNKSVALKKKGVSHMLRLHYSALFARTYARF